MLILGTVAVTWWYFDFVPLMMTGLLRVLSLGVIERPSLSWQTAVLAAAVFLLVVLRIRR